ncbi:hypothetical protein BKA82DRAFT_2633155 [Pisolithus tinctorius]|nr:hypothetical protein BKA82DRAFT_2633155 [Pisolithus tinctorius]
MLPATLRFTAFVFLRLSIVPPRGHSTNAAGFADERRTMHLSGFKPQAAARNSRFAPGLLHAHAQCSRHAYTSEVNARQFLSMLTASIQPYISAHCKWRISLIRQQIRTISSGYCHLQQEGPNSSPSPRKTVMEAVSRLFKEPSFMFNVLPRA